MKENSPKQLGIFTKKFVIYHLFFLFFLAPSVLTAQPFSNSSENSPFSSGSTTVAPSVNQSGGGVVYSPFSPFSGSQLQNGSEPVLYGPGGNPIGGLPLENGSLVLFGLVLTYTLFRLVSTRFKSKKS